MKKKVSYSWIKRSLFKVSLYDLIFLVLNILFYVNILIFNSKIGVDTFSYENSAHHFFGDPRIEGKPFNLLNSLSQYDAQWHLKIAQSGYPMIERGLESVTDKMTYAFFPLYPLLIGSINFFLNNLELSAFLLSIILIFINYKSLIYIVSKHYDKNVAVKTSYLLFFFPFSVFFRSYFAEGIFLFLLLWFSFYLSERKYLRSSFFLALLNVTKANAFLLNILFVYVSFKDFFRGKLRRCELVTSLVILSVPFLVWIYFNYLNTGDFTYFYSARTYWQVSGFMKLPFLSILHNIALVILFPFLPFHKFHTSKLDIITVLFFLFLWIKSKNYLKPIYRLVSFLLWLFPLLVTDTMSFSRYQSVNFPVFVFLAQILTGKKFITVFILFFGSLLITSLFFVNWWWIG